jgi:disulfide bond formation protein DsbB
LADRDTEPRSRDDLALTAAFLVALTATRGALFIGEFLGQMPCTLC